MVSNPRGEGRTRRNVRPPPVPAHFEPLEGRTLFCDWGGFEAASAASAAAPTASTAAPRAASVATVANRTAYALGGGFHLDAASVAGPAIADPPAPVKLAASATWATPLTPSPGSSTLRIETGGTSSFTDSSGRVWSPDGGFSGGTASTGAYSVANTADDRLYSTRRWGNFSYSRAVSSGLYTLKLHFADPLYTAPGFRLFDAFAEGAQILNDFDIAANGGGKAALVKTFTVNVTDGRLDLSFRGVRENAILSALELEPPGTATAAPPFPWSAAGNLPVGRHESAAAVVRGKLYVFGGYYTTAVQATRRVDRFDPATGRWTRLADMPEPITHAGVAVDGDTVWLAGGFIGDNPGPSTSHVWKYDATADAWSAGPALPAPRSAGGLALLGKKLHYFGGYGTGHIYKATDQPDHYVLDLSGGTKWTTAAPMPNPRNHLGAAEVGGKIYAIGGQKGGGTAEAYANQDDLHVYDAATNSWKELAPMPGGRGHIAGSTFVMNDRIVVAGGVKNGPVPLPDVIEYDPGTNTWVALPPLPAPRQAGVAALLGDKIVFTGGETGAARSQSDTWVGVLKNKWETAASLPTALAETAGGVIGNKLYLVGEGSPSTFIYNLSTNVWTLGASRPHVGDHHAAEVYNGRLYLFGGFNGGAAGKVQIYSPTTNTWSLGAPMPFAPGSPASVRIGGDVYVAGGIINFVPNVGGQTTNLAAKYSLASNTWTMLPPMPRGVNHAAGSTDGRRVYIFGGRAGHGGVEDGFDTVQVYDPSTRTWKSSDAAGSGLAPLPQARGGTGKAVYYGGEFYVLGGETKTGAGATADRTYRRVDVYNPSTNAWRLAPPMPTARHGIFPLLHAGRIYVAAGGTKAGASRSTVLEVLNLD